MNYITTSDKTKLYVKDWGTGRPVILMHGWPLSSDSWDDQAMALAQAGHRTIAYDRRGFGRSTQPWAAYDYDTLADDLAAVIERPAPKTRCWRAFPWAAAKSRATCPATVARAWLRPCSFRRSCP